MTTPYNEPAECAVVGAMLLSVDAVPTAAAMLRPEDFYKPLHGAIFAACVDLWKVGVRPDAVVVAERLTAQKVTFENHDLITLQVEAVSLNPTPHARIVAEYATRRRLITVATVLSNAAQDPTVALDDTLDAARAELEVSRLPSSVTVSDVTTWDEFCARPEPPHSWAVEGLIDVEDRVIIVAPEGMGKALALDTPIPSPRGWRTMGDLRHGDVVFGDDGRPCSVTFVTEIMLDRPCFRVVFSDGSVIVADAEHQWQTIDYQARQGGFASKVVTTEQIRATLRARGGHVLNHAIPTCAPLEMSPAALPIDPYVMGAWLGDGTSDSAVITCADPEILDQFRLAGYTLKPIGTTPYGWGISGGTEIDRVADQVLEAVNVFGASKAATARKVGIHRDAVSRIVAAGGPVGIPHLSLQVALRNEGVLGDKHIPEAYLRGSYAQRLALLQGLMDTDGTVNAKGTKRGRGSGASICEFSVTCERLARDVFDLLVGLGIKTRFQVGTAVLKGRRIGPRYRMSFQTDLPVFRLTRKAARLGPLNTRRAKLRYITAVDPVDSVPVKCIQVDSPNHMYLAGEACIPTHNTMLMRQIALAAGQGLHPFDLSWIAPITTLLVDLENPGRIIRSKGRPMLEQARIRTGDDYEPTRTWIWHRPGGIDLRTRTGAAELNAVCAQVRPALVCIGPLYKSYRAADARSEHHAALEVAAVLDDLRTRHGFALVLEAHAPMKQGGVRDLRPFGTLLWQQWPEVGLKLIPEGEEDTPWFGHTLKVGSWRGARDERPWPTTLVRNTSGGWPWVAA